MKKLSVIFTAIFIIVAVLSGCSEKEEYRMVKVEVKDGEVIVDRSEESMDAFEGMNLIAYDYVGVKEKSYIVLLVDDDKHISAEENTEFSVNATGTKNNGSVTVELVKGKALFEIDEKLDENSYFSVKTPNTTLSVRGTTFTVLYDDINDITYLEVSDGIVNIKTKENNLSEDVTAGESRKITSGFVETVESIEDKKINRKKLMKMTRFGSNGTVNYLYEYEYDHNGILTKRTVYKPDGTISYIYEYDENGGIVKMSGYTPDGTSCFLYDNEYDEKGNMTKQTKYNDDGTISSWDEYEYDESGNRTKSVSYNADGTMTSQTVSEYNSDGKMSKYTSYNADGTISLWNENEYDENGSRTKSVSYNADGTISSWREYGHDEKGNLKITEYLNNGNPKLRLTEIYEYDEDGNILKDIVYGADGKISYWVLYEYE